MTGVRGMSLVRRAVPEDAREVLRLRQVVIDTLPGSDPATDWHAQSLPGLRERLGETEGNFAAFVVDHPERPGALAALVAGTVDYRIGKAGDPHGAVGFVFSVATDPDARRWGSPRARLFERGEGTRARAWTCCWTGARGRACASDRLPGRRAALCVARVPAQARTRCWSSRCERLGSTACR